MTRMIAVLAGAILLVAAGCGGGGDGGGTPLTKEEYEQQMQTIGQDLSSALDTSGATDADSAVAQIEEAQSTLTTAADEMDEMTPPEDIATEHDQLVEGVRQFSDDLDGVISAVEGGDMQAVSDMMSLDSLQAIQSASAAITAKGYDIA
jgi:hypothetical protein